ncbi:MAG: response regulator [Desulfatibacillaceae bacterium]
MRKYSILLVDDDPFILKTMGPYLESRGYEVATALNGSRALKLLETDTFDLVLTDLVMGEPDGLQVLGRTKETSPDTMVILLTGYGDMNSAIDALRLGADDYLLKPCEPAEIHFRLKGCFEKLEYKRRIKAYEDILPVCCMCKKIRDDTGTEHGRGRWKSVEQYMWQKAGLAPSSTYCPECLARFRQELETGWDPGKE